MSHCDTFKTQLASIMDVLAKAVVAEMSKLVSEAGEDSPAILSMEITRFNENEAPKKKSQLIIDNNLWTAQLASVMEILTKEALDKIGKLVEEGSAVLHPEMSQSQNEGEALKRTRRGSDLRTQRGHGEGRVAESSAHKPSRSVGVQVGDEFRGAGHVSEEEPPTISMWSDGEPTAVGEEEAPLQSLIMSDKSTDIEDRPGPLLIKDSKLELGLVKSDSQRGLQMSEETEAVESSAYTRERLPYEGQCCEEERDTQLTPTEEEQDPQATPAELSSDIKNDCTQKTFTVVKDMKTCLKASKGEKPFGCTMNETDGLRFRRLNRPQIITDESQEPQYKGTSTYSGKVFRVTLLTLGSLLLFPLLGVILLLESPIEPEVVSLNEPPLMSDCFEPNFKLRQAERLLEGQLVGPESVAHIGDVLYTGTADGKIVKIEGRNLHVLATLGQPPCGSRDHEPTCGRPLGIRAGPNGTLYVADAYLGLFEVHPVTGKVDNLVSTTQVVGGRRLSFVNDLDVTRDGRKVYFTDSSSRWQRRDYLHLIMEATADGRVLEYDTLTREVSVLMDGLRFANGIELCADEESVLVAETTMARIRRVHVAGLNKGGMDTFVDNLPGFPDNIRRSSSGGYWVAMSAVRPNPGFSMLDFLSQKPWIKKLIFKLFSQEVLMKFVPRYSLVLELRENGACRRSFHDPHGMVAAYVSEAHEHDGYLFLGSFRSPYLCKLDLSQV
ncbi:hypothetical protein AAFF_G00140430 [Aldrovandia affinis]|uniref:Adipocyte plasma membrane-associated protein n=1 Tax=Aldrovandia affinis TaxID=143900 RepID=A0AAD7X405_9TELE|nr:hypothetical protein AAFF_G00140430 [Aldrovandia affinis]